MASGNSNGGGNSVMMLIALGISGISMLFSVGNSILNNAQTIKTELHAEIRDLKADFATAEKQNEARLLRLSDRTSEKLLTKDEHIEFKSGIKEAAANLREEISRVRGDQVTRSEHQQHWSEVAARIDAVRELNVQLRREVTDTLAALQKEVGGQFTVGDQIKNLQDQIKILNGKMITNHN